MGKMMAGTSSINFYPEPKLIALEKGN